MLHTAAECVANRLTPTEKPLVFLNKGIFSKGKDGMLITDKCIFRITKKMIYQLALHDICSMNATPKNFTYNDWQFNNNSYFEFGFASDIKATAIFLGLICTLARDCHSENYKIIVNNQTI